MDTCAATALYLRISEDRLGLELGVDRQREDCLTLARSRGWTDLREWTDNDMSAATGRTRPGYRALMAAVASGQVARIVVWQQSRLWRSRRERAEGIEVLRKARASLIAVKGPELDMATASGRALAGLLGEFDTWESDVKSERAAREVIQRAEQGRHHGGPRAYGYTRDGMRLVDDEAARLARWYREFLVGRTIMSIAAEAGKTHATIREMLLNPRNCGLRILHGVEYPGRWPAVVAVEVWRATAAALAAPERRRYAAGSARRWLGSGLYGCERCDPATGTVGAGGNRTYRCLPARGGCSRTWQAGPIDEWVTDAVAARLATADAAALLPRDRPDLDALRAEAHMLKGKLAKLAGQWADDLLTDEQLAAANGRLRERLGEVQAVLGDAGRVGPLADLLARDDPAAAWLAIPEGEVVWRQAVVRSLATVVLGAPVRGRRPWSPAVVGPSRWVGDARTWGQILG